MVDPRIVDRYSGLARAALAVDTIHDCQAEDFDQGGFGAAGYDNPLDLPQE